MTVTFLSVMAWKAVMQRHLLWTNMFSVPKHTYRMQRSFLQCDLCNFKLCHTVPVKRSPCVTKLSYSVTELHSNLFVKNSFSFLTTCKHTKTGNSVLFRQHGLRNHCRNYSIYTVLYIADPILRTLSVMVGIKIRHWWKNLTPDEKTAFFEVMKRNMVSVLVSFILVHSGFLMLYAYYLEFDPVTKRRKLVLFTDDQISEIATSEQKRIIQRHEARILPTTHRLHQMIVKIVTKIVDSNDEIPNIRNKSWSIYVVDSPEIRNAFVLPNGAIFFFTGLLTVASNDDQTSVILSHEMAHTVLSHMSEQISNVHFHNLLFNLAIIVIWASMPILYAFPCQWLAEYLTKMFVELPFSRNLELEADKVGLILSAKACFDVREASLLWSKLKLLATLEGGVSTEPAEMFSTHPSYETRRRHLESQMPAALKLREKCACPRLPGNDPREFIHIMLHDLEELQKNHKSIYILSKILASGNQSR